MTAEEQLRSEARFARYAVAAAFGAVALLVASLAISSAAVRKVNFHGHVIKTVNNQAELFIFIHKQPALHLATAAVGALSYPLLAFVVYVLYRMTRARRPRTPRVIPWLLLVTPVASGAIQVVSQAIQNHQASKFVHGTNVLGKAGVKHAEHLATQGGAAAVQYGGLVVALGFAVAIIMVCVNAIRAGILSRGMGYFGAAVGVLVFIPFGYFSFILEIFWLGAIGVLFLNRWPGGRGPAWETVEAIPWPTPADRRAQVEAERGGPAGPRPQPRPSGGELARRVRAASTGDGDDGAAAATAVSDAEAASPARSHPRSKKRKRKRR